MAKYSSAVEGVSKEEQPYRFINNVGKNRACQQKPYVYAVC